MRRPIPGPCRHLKNNYCSVKAKIITPKDGVYRECMNCPRARRR